MQSNTPYALHDSDGFQPLRWAAHVRLTPELLHKLRHSPAQVSLRLNASSSSAANGQPSKNKTSVLSVLQQQTEEAEGDDADTALPVMEQYELLSFREDPRVNHVCTFRRESASAASSAPSSGDGGYAIYKTGVIHQKLIVQRLLDATEKDRMKDRHAKSVLDSRARSSKLLEQQPPETKKRRIAVLETTKRGPAKTVPMKANAISVELLPKLTLRSALSTELAQQTRERIEKGAEKASPPVFQPSAVAPPAAPTQRDDHFDSQSRATTEADQPNSSSAVLFSSDSEKEVEVSTPARIKSVAQPADDSTPVTHEKKPQADGQVAPEKKTENPATFSQAPSSPLLLPIPRKSLSEVPETKRPRPRSNPLPDLSFLPPVVQEICKRLARQIPRSAIVDQADYDKFVRQYETHRSEWELLDKAYSIEVVKASKRKEGLAFLQESMAMLQKMLAHIQSAIAKYERKLEAAASVQ